MPTIFQNMRPSHTYQYTLPPETPDEGSWDDVHVQSVQLLSIPTGDIHDSVFRECIWEGQTASRRFYNVQFHSVKFNETAEFHGATFIHCLFRSCTFTWNNMYGANFVDCKFVNTNLHYTGLNSSSFTDVLFEGGSVRNVDAASGTWRDFAMHGTTVWATSFVNTTFTNGYVKDTTFRETSFDGASFINVQRLEDVDFLLCTSRGVQQKRCRFFAPIPQYTCMKCKEKFTGGDYRVSVKYRLCGRCAGVKGYSTTNDLRVGKKGVLPTFSIEFEVDGLPDSPEGSQPNPLQLVRHGFEHCSDCTVGSEYKSPIYNDMVAFSHVLPILDANADYVKSTCGTHIHVGAENRGRIKHHIDEFFGLVLEHMEDDLEETEEFWGRGFNQYARAGFSNEVGRYAWLNSDTGGKPTIEFRLPRFKNARQYRAVVQFARESIGYLDRKCAFYMDDVERGAAATHILGMYLKAVAGLLQTA